VRLESHEHARVRCPEPVHEPGPLLGLTRLEEIIGEVRAGLETELTEFNGDNDHVHLLVNFPPKIAFSRLVNSLKGVSSRRMRQEFPEPAAHYHRANKLWSGSYFAGSAAGAPLSIVRQYIEQQNRPG
jgi:REP-associated tyrosine transposase